MKDSSSIDCHRFHFSRYVIILIFLISIAFFLVIFKFLSTIPLLESSISRPLPQPQAWAIATLVTDSFPSGYVCGALVLARSIHKVSTRADLVAMVTPQVDSSTRQALQSEGYQIFDIMPIPHPNPANLQVNRFLNTYSKLAAWRLIQYQKIVLMDADMIVLKPIDELFEFEELGAVVDCCDKFNSGMLVIQPSLEIYQYMVDLIPSIPSYDGGDQGFLNEYFKSRWHRIPYRFNAVQTTFQSGAWELSQVHVLHLMEFKPWKPLPAEHSDLALFHDLWWEYEDNVDLCFQP